MADLTESSSQRTGSSFDAVRTQLMNKVDSPAPLSLQYLLWVLEEEDSKTLNFVSAPHFLLTWSRGQDSRGMRMAQVWLFPTPVRL